MASIRGSLTRIPPLLRNRLSSFWVPTGGITPIASEQDDPHALLIRAGFLRQAYTGIFHLLPLGLRVQEKLQDLVDHHMRSIGASKLSLSSVSSSELWQKTGRLDETSTEFLQIQDRRNSGYLLSPTHEEEITTLIKGTVKSYKDLPLRLYQIGRKYRDELRPRQGLLRTKEFLMKDLYTFDVTQEEAKKSYEDVTKAYGAFFKDLQVPYTVAAADSGNMGGNLSHEYHFLTPRGEDNVVSCTHCTYTANEEVAERDPQGLSVSTTLSIQDLGIWPTISKDRRTLVLVFFPKSSEKAREESSPDSINPRSVEKLVPNIDLSIEDPVQSWTTVNSNRPTEPQSILHIYDTRLSADITARLRLYSRTVSVDEMVARGSQGISIDLVKIKEGDACPHCSEGTLQIQRGIEVGHTFYLGTRYSEPLDAIVSTPTQSAISMQMGCHGIGISRLIGAVAAASSNSIGLRWPRAIAPFDVVIIVPMDGLGIQEDITWCYDALRTCNIKSRKPYIDPVIDDRKKHFGWKLKDADLIGYPVSILLGKAWSSDRLAEVKCPALESNDLVAAEDLVELAHLQSPELSGVHRKWLCLEKGHEEPMKSQTLRLPFKEPDTHR
ncbi:prolyl-tRNA synthetase [Viridothelium virens]|uniref:proline--tRNA ligase n=1 Tax=Viridothelium virens TaxID=1048519 RepID=A0A6A6HAR7_VIRVR|nr:prolyl-tRNA synthetase [Viridothelium virens]